MLIQRDRLLDAPVMSLQTGGQLATITSAIIDPRRLHLVAFYCTGPHVDLKSAVIYTNDIREIGPLGIIIDSADKIMDANEQPRLKEVIDFNFTLEGKVVVDDGKHRLGKVANYSLETVSFYIIKLHIRPGFLQSLGTAELLIDRNQIISIDDREIIVRQADNRESAPLIPKLSIDNPFRKSKAQPDAAHSIEHKAL